jgi:hypothetical protein
MRQNLLILVSFLVGCGGATSPDPATVNFRLVPQACSSVLPIALSIDSAVVATDTFRVDVPAEHLQSRDFPVRAGVHTIGARVVGGFVWPSRAVTVGAGAVVTDSLPFYCS